MPRTPTNYTDPIALLERVARRAIGDEPHDLEAMYNIIVPVASWYHSIANSPANSPTNGQDSLEAEFYRVKSWQAIMRLMRYTNKYKTEWCECLHDLLGQYASPAPYAASPPRLPFKLTAAHGIVGLLKRIKNLRSPSYSQHDADQLGKVAQAVESYISAFTGPTLPVKEHRELYAKTVRGILPYMDVPAYKRQLIFALLDQLLYVDVPIKAERRKPRSKHYTPSLNVTSYGPDPDPWPALLIEAEQRNA